MKDYSNPYKRKFAFLATIKDSDNKYDSASTHIVVARDIGKAASMARDYANSQKGAKWVESVVCTEANEHVIY